MSDNHRYTISDSSYSPIKIEVEKEMPVTVKMYFNTPYGCTVKEITATPENNGWISVDDKMPGDGLLVLCFDKYGFYNIAWHSGESQAWFDTNEALCLDVVYWMPLPKAPKEN